MEKMDFKSDCPKLPWMIDFHSNEDGTVLNKQYKAAFANTTLEYLGALDIKSQTSPFKSTQLICSIPANVTCNSLEMLMDTGMSVARISAQNLDKVRELLSKVRTVNDSYSRKQGKVYSLAIALEIKGPEIRTGKLKSPNKQVYLEKGKKTTLTTDPLYEEFVNEDIIFVDYEKLPDIVQPGDKVLLDNGSVTLTALECIESIIRCIVDKAGSLLDRVSVSVPNAPIDIPLISADDKRLIDVATGENVDFIFLCGITSKESITAMLDLLGQAGEHIQIITKIDNSLAIEYIDEIIQSSDAICIDCEKLMNELSREKVFLVQKSLFAKCNLAGKPVISSVSLCDARQVSKSEISDIANAIIDGTDALLLPPEACTKNIMKSVSKICSEAESAVYQKQLFNELANVIPAPMELIYSLAIAAVETSLKSNAAAIICVTSSGRTAKLISRFRPKCPIIAITRYMRIARQLTLYRSVEPLVYLRSVSKGGDWNQDINDRIQFGLTYGKYVGYIRTADAVVTVSPSRPECGMPNTMRVVYASEFDAIPKPNKSLA